MSENRSIVLGVTGSIAAYRSAELVRLMTARGWTVNVVMTEGATRFVGALTFETLSRNPVGLSLWDTDTGWKPEHIAAAEKANAFVIAPCTANVMAKIAHGIADDLLTCSVLATSAPLIIAPAMNVHMWQNAATRANVETLRSRGIQIVDVAEGDLACGYEGEGRMAGPEIILDVAGEILR